MGGGLRAELSCGAIGSLTVGLAGTLFGLVLAVILARKLGPEGYGIYAYVFALVSLLAIPAQLGLPNLLIRETARAHVNAEWGLMRGLWHWATLAVGGFSVLLVAVALLLGGVFSEQFSSTQLATFVFGIMLVPLIALGNLRGAALRGLRYVVMGQLPETVLRPGILILLLLTAVLYISPAQLSPEYVMGLHVVAAAMSFIIGAFMLWKVRPIGIVEEPKPVYTASVWFAAAWPLALLSGMQLINQNTDIIILGFFRSIDEVGIYKVSVTGASLVVFGLQAITMAVSPHFARLHSQGDMKQLQRLVTQSSRVILMFSLPVVLLLVFFGDQVLFYVFGEKYISGGVPLAILAGGQLLSVFMGAVGVLLMMAGHERDVVRGVAIGAGVNVLLNFVLIPPFGMAGAATATAVSMFIWKFILWRVANIQLGLDSMAFKIHRLNI